MRQTTKNITVALLIISASLIQAQTSAYLISGVHSSKVSSSGISTDLIDVRAINRYTGGNYNWAWKGNGSNGISIPAHFDLYPIPNFSLSSNPNLTQNPGY